VEKQELPFVINYSIPL